MRRGTRLGIVLPLALAALAGAACSRELDPFEAADRDEGIGASPNRLTFGSANDRSPIWSAGGDSIFFNTEGGEHLPSDPGVLVGLPVTRGITAPILQNAQQDGDILQQWLVTPALAPDAERLAFIEIESTWPPHPCDLALTVLACAPSADESEVRRPEVRRIVVRVRRFDATGPLADDPGLIVPVPGVTVAIEETPNPVEVSTVSAYPFQQLFTSERAYVFRATWSPDGERLAFSDGLSIRIWTVGAGTSVVVPGTGDGSWPAWSPDGDWIAFARLERADSTSAVCDYIGGFGPLCRQVRTDYIPGRRVLSLVRPDGSELVEIGEGDEPAWSPDGASLFFRRAGQIWRSDPDGTGAAPVPGTEGGREPAVSPDGRFLAFARLSSRGDYDIWVIAL